MSKISSRIGQYVVRRNQSLFVFFEKEFLALGSSTNLKKRKGHLEGEISGINAFNTPFWFDRFYKPGKKIAQIDDWDDRLEAIVEAAETWDIGAIAGIPSWVLMMLKAIKKHYQLETILFTIIKRDIHCRFCSCI